MNPIDLKPSQELAASVTNGGTPTGQDIPPRVYGGLRCGLHLRPALKCQFSLSFRCGNPSVASSSTGAPLQRTATPTTNTECPQPRVRPPCPASTSPSAALPHSRAVPLHLPSPTHPCPARRAAQGSQSYPCTLRRTAYPVPCPGGCLSPPRCQGLHLPRPLGYSRTYTPAIAQKHCTIGC